MQQRKNIFSIIGLSLLFIAVVAAVFLLLRNHFLTTSEIDANRKEVTATYEQDNVSVSFPEALLVDTVEGTVDLEVDVSDTVQAVQKVEYYANDQLIATSTTEPYTYSWDTTSLVKKRETVTFTIKVYDQGGLVATLSKTVTINNNGNDKTESPAKATGKSKKTSNADSTTTDSSSGGSTPDPDPEPTPDPTCGSGTVGTYPNCYTKPPVSPPSGSWVLQWQDEFSGSSLNTANWSYAEPWKSEPGYASNDAWRTLPAGDLVEVSGGSLKIKALNRPDNPGGLPMQAGKVLSRDKFNSFVHGYIEARVSIPSGADLWSSFWLLGNGLGSEGWPKTGEIDIFEFVNNGSDNGEPNFTVHYGPDISTHYQKPQYGMSPLANYTSMHTYGLYRTSSKLHIYIDGVYAHGFNAGDTDGSGHVLTSALFNNAMFVNFNISAGGWGDDPSSPPEDGQMVIDYIRAWKYE